MASLLHEWYGGGIICSVAVSRDGSFIGVACGSDVVMLATDTAQPVLGPLKGHTAIIWSIVFSPDGRTLASGSWDKSIRLWDTQVGKAVMEPLTGHDGEVKSVIYTLDGRWLISGSNDGTIRFWDTRTGEPAGQNIHANSGVFAVALSPDGMKFTSGCSSGIIRTYDTATRTMLFECTGHEGTVYSVAFSPDGKRLASVSADLTVRLWDGQTGHAIGNPLEGHTDWIRSVSFSPDGQYIASAARDSTMRIWGTGTNARQGIPIFGHKLNTMAVTFTPDGSRLVSGSEDKSIKIWDVRYFEVTEFFKPPQVTKSAELEIEITATTSTQEIISRLSTHGCIDMTHLLDWTTCSDIPISSGGFGDIYKCALTSRLEVAIKTIRVYASVDERNRKVLKRAAREIYTWSKFRHPNIQPLLGLTVFRNQIGMVAKWELNGSLPQYLERHPEADRCAMSTQIADGLEYLHSSGVVHGDLKGVRICPLTRQRLPLNNANPKANVLVSWVGSPLLTDFGSALLQEYTLQFSQTSTTGNLTVRWAAPELLLGEKRSRQADIYALGMTIMETVTGEVPWVGKTEMGVLSAVAFEKAIPERPTAHIPIGMKHADALWALLKLCWMYDPTDRPTANTVKITMKGVTQTGLQATSAEDV